MSIESKDLEHIERLLYKSIGEGAISFARSFERLEEMISALETMVLDNFEVGREEMTKFVDQIRDEIRAIADEEE